jgi:serine/threonine-protein kinase
MITKGSDPVLDDVIEEVANRLQAGEPVDAEAILARYPERADSIRRLLPAIEVMAEFGVSASKLAARGVPAGVGPLDMAQALGALGDFRILREVGRGGMGVVYEAEQMSLGRRVALKVLPFAGALVPQQLRRFQTEARAAAQLHHTNIVPVFWVGCEQGVHYYAMQFIEGRTLADVIRELRDLEGIDAGGTGFQPVSERITGKMPVPLNAERGSNQVGSGPPQDVPRPTGERVAEGRVRGSDAGHESQDPADHSSEPSAPVHQPSGTGFQPVSQSTTGKMPVPLSAGSRSPDPTEGPLLPDADRPGRTSASSTRNRAYFRNAARLGVEAAEALEHAHQEGIIHRDIKPANLMVDARGHLWVTDFGLARLQSDSGLTNTGDLLGTLRYMSPEQALGKRSYLDHRTDIYSLGATLYEITTLRPAIDGKDRQEVLVRIAQDEPAPPRRRDPTIPRELETILLKAMGKEPGDRYATAQELADDLRRFLEHKPIRARRPTLLERGAKWARRHPAFPAFGFVLLAVVTTGLAIGSTLLRRKQIEVSRQRDRANELAGIADSQRVRAEQNARLARRSVDEMFTQVADKWLADQPRLEPVQREFLEKALQFYEEFSSQEDADPAAKQSVADAWRHVGQIRLRLGMIRPAEDAFRRALTVATGLADASPADRELRYRVAKPYLSLAVLLLADGRPNDATDAYRRAEELARTLTDGTSGPSHHRGALADALGGQGLIHLRLSRTAEAERHLGQAITIQERLVLESPQDSGLRSILANHFNNLSATLSQVGRFEEAKAACRRAMELRQTLLDLSPESKDLQDELAMSIANMGNCCYMTKEFGQSETLFRRALPIRRKLVADFPRVPDYRKRLAEDLDNLASVLRNTERAREAEPFRREAIDVLEGLVHDHPELPEYRTALGDRQSNLGVLLMGLDKKADTEVALRRAMQTLEPLIAAHPEIPARFVRFLECARTRGEILIGLGRIPEVETLFLGTLDLINRLEPRSPRIASFAEQRFRLVMAFSELLKKQHRDAEAREILEREMEWIESLVKGNPPAAWGQELWIWAAGRLSKLLSTSADAKVRDMDRALALANRSRDHRPQSGDVWNVIGETYYRGGHWDEAISALKKAEDLRRPHEDVTGWYHLAMAYWQKGDKEQARQYYGKAADWMNKNPYKNDEFTRLRDEASAMLGMVDPAATTGKKEDNPKQPSKP